MAWWTHLLFYKTYLDDYRDKGIHKEDSIFADFNHALRQYLYDNFVDILYFVLSVLTYVYLGLTIVTFFFHSYVPSSFPGIIEALSEPYLGALGIYVVVREIERRKGRMIRKPWGELFAIIWFLFFVAATFLTYFSDQYHINMIYKTVVTNALAALIIRIGTLLR